MLVERTFDLPADVGYILDGACEEHEILGCHHYAISTYGEVPRLDEIMNRERTGRGIRGRRQMTDDICAYANEIIAAMPEHERAWVAVLAHAHARRIVDDYADHLASWNFEDATVGGCAIAFRSCLRMDRDGNPTPKARRKLHSPKAIRRYVRLYDLDFLLSPLAVLKLLPLPNNASLADGFYREQERRIRERRDAQYAAMARVIDANRAGLKKAPKQIKTESTARKVVKRAAVLASALLGASTVAAFAKGEPVQLSGQNINFEIRAAGKLSSVGHGGIKIMLSDKTGEKLAGLCVYHKDTPALDQLTAFALRIESGEEEEIVKVGNLYQVTPVGAQHDLLKSRIKKEEPLGFYPDARLAGSRSPQFQARMAQYLGATLDIYRDAIATFLFGRRARSIITFRKDNANG